MSLELLQSIEAAEAKAEEIRADAQREAREMLKAVEEACVSDERQAALDQRALAQRILEDARQAAQARIDAEAAEEAATREAMVSSARAKLDAAVDLIFERVVSDGHR